MAAKARLRLDGADPINRGLVGFWPLTDGAGGRALDISTFRNNGALENSPGQYSTLLGKALNFTGGGAGATNVNLGNPNQFNALQVPLTITGWAFPTASPLDSQTMLAQYGAFAAGKLVKHVSINAGVLRYISSQSGGVLQVFTAGSMTANTWQFWAIVMSGTHASPSLAMYVNQGVTTHTPGALDASPDTSIATRIGTSTTALITPSNEGYQGRLQNVRMWSRALSRAEIQRLYREPWAGTARPVRRAVPVPGTQYTLATDALAYEHTVGDAGLGWGRWLDTEALAYEHAVGDAGFVVRRTLQAEAVAYRYTVPAVALNYYPAQVDGDTHDGFKRRSRRQRALDAAERRRREAVAQEAVTLRLSLEAAMGMAAEVVEEAPAEAVEAVQAVARKAARLVPTLADTRADEALLASAREAVAALRAAVDEAARAKALAEDDEDVLMLLRAL